MTDEKPKHKPSPKRTLEEVLKSLQDLIRNDLVSGRGREEPAAPVAPPSPALQEDSESDDLTGKLDALDALITHELIEPTERARDVPEIDPAFLDLEALPEKPAGSGHDENVAPEPATDLGTIPQAADDAPGQDDATEAFEATFDLDSLPGAEPPMDARPKETQAQFSFDERFDAPDEVRPTSTRETPAETPTGTDFSLLEDAPRPAIDETPDVEPPAFEMAEEIALTGADMPAPEAAVPPALEDDGIPVLSEIADLPADAPLPEPERARELAIRVIARLNIERRKAGQAPLDIKTIERLQQLLREALASPDSKRG